MAKNTDSQKTTATVQHQDAPPTSSFDNQSFAVGFLICVIVVYFLPWIVAKSRGHGSSMGIFFLNLFLGWTLIGWVIALSWAGSKK